MRQAAVKPTLKTEQRPPERSRAREYALAGAVVLVALVLYLYPFLATRAQIGPSPLPPLFAPDLYTYMNLSHLQVVAPQTVANPWYGLAVPTSAVTYRKFGLSLVLFDGLRRAAGGSWSTAIALWMLLWTVLIGTAAIWFFRRTLPQPRGLPLALGMALLLLLDLRTLPAMFSAWLHLPSLRGFEALALPYVRQFFPQVGIPPVLVYLAMLGGTLRSRRWAPWLAMALLQVLAFALFPYAMLLLAGTTGVAVVLALRARRLEAGYARVAVFAALCAALDLVYLLEVGPVGASGSGSLLVPQPALLLHLLLSKTLLLVVLVTVLLCLARSGENQEGRWTLIGMGVTTALLLLADAVVSPALQISHHGLYFVHVTLAAELAWLIACFYPRWVVRRPGLRWVAAALLAGLLLEGALAAHGNYRTFLAFNRTQKEEAALLLPLDLQPDDLVIVPARFVDDTCSWLPLLTRAQTLFCRNAEFVLPRQEADSIQDFRLGLYLDLVGKDQAWAEQVLAPGGELAEQDFLSLTQERLALEGPERPAALAGLRLRVAGTLARAQAGGPEVEQFFRRYKRILVVDRADDPTFSRARLRNHVTVEKEERMGGYVLLWCRAT